MPWITDRLPAPNDPLSAIETPSLVVDLDRMERNVDRMVSIAEEHGVTLRSHAKTHKVAEIANRQANLPCASGIMCQTLDECIVMARNGITDIHLARMVVAESKLEKLVRIADRIDRFAVSVDHPDTFEPLQTVAKRYDTTVEVVLELDVNVRRTGVRPEEALETARAITRQSHLRFEGILGHDGLVKTDAETLAEYEAAVDRTVSKLADVEATLEDAGIAVPEVKTGSSATAEYAARHGVVTELNPGRYPFWDGLHLQHRPDLSIEDCAVSVLTTVISRPTTDRAIVDAGRKVLSPIETPVPVSERKPDLDFHRATSEHGIVDVTAHDGEIEVGDRLSFVVPSVNDAINLADHLVGVRDGRVETVWPVQARGASK